ncbi:hypothetical protein RND71_012083 [Anisodus tanguticus]|uniref:Uncharacterized protein n=1 Tax=Anisodus tanguticus TaxID=243964 RepID=A0AAE1VLH0_9SOLA|nr:hypothetical protein RND71_012083 [Anisodus tanguticus]
MSSQVISGKWMIFKVMYMLSLILFISNSVKFSEARLRLLEINPPTEAPELPINIPTLQDSLALAPEFHTVPSGPILEESLALAPITSQIPVYSSADKVLAPA